MARANYCETLLKHIGMVDNTIDHDIIYCDAHALELDRAMHFALWQLLLEVDHDAAMSYRNTPETIERARKMHEHITR